MSYKGVKVLDIFIHTLSDWELHPPARPHPAGHPARRSQELPRTAAASRRSPRPCSGERAARSCHLRACGAPPARRAAEPWARVAAQLPAARDKRRDKRHDAQPQPPAQHAVRAAVEAHRARRGRFVM
eukprot:7205548-Prymnesium_polylepis.1